MEAPGTQDEAPATGEGSTMQRGRGLTAALVCLMVLGAAGPAHATRLADPRSATRCDRRTGRPARARRVGWISSDCAGRLHARRQACRRRHAGAVLGEPRRRRARRRPTQDHGRSGRPRRGTPGKSQRRVLASVVTRPRRSDDTVGPAGRRDRPRRRARLARVARQRCSCRLSRLSKQGADRADDNDSRRRCCCAVRCRRRLRGRGVRLRRQPQRAIGPGDGRDCRMPRSPGAHGSRRAPSDRDIADVGHAGLDGGER